MNQPTLIIQTVYFNDSDRESAMKLGTELYELLTRPIDDSLSYGPGIPVFRAVEPRFVDLDAADHVVIIPVLGKTTHIIEGSRKRAINTIREWHKALGDGHIIPVPTSTKWRAEELVLPVGNLLTALYENEDRQLRTLDEIVLGILRVLDPDSKKKRRLFISHSKADLEATKDAAAEIHRYVVNDTTGNTFFDVNDICPGRSIQEQINNAFKDSVFVSIRTDSYSSRNWCQKELLLAKQNTLPSLTVFILENGESLSSPYGGNGPTMLWKGNAQTIVSRAMVECLRAIHFQEEAKRTILGAALPDNSVILCRPPELLDLVQGPANTHQALVIIYPDPELSVSHRNLLGAANPHLKLVTPTSAFRRIGKELSSVTNPFEGLQVALSLSNSPDVDGPEGYSKHHVEDATVYLARSLISAGAHIAYGGDFRKAGYTEVLANLVSAYREITGGEDMLHSYLAGCTSIEEVPDELAVTVHHMSLPPFSEQAVLPEWTSTPLPKPPEPLYYSDLRRVMSMHTDARVVIGGEYEPRIDELDKNGYGGRYPGVIEEVWWSLQIKQPLYIIGGFGGAAGIVASLIEDQETPNAMQDATWKIHSSFEERSNTIDNSLYKEKLKLPTTLESLAEDVRKLGTDLLVSDIKSLTWNGLTTDQNRTLLRSRDPIAITTLVYKGLRNISRKGLKGKLEIELVKGDVTAARDIDAIAIGVFDDIPLGGAGAEIDKVLAGYASLARDGGQSFIGLEFGDLAANWLYFASLGSFMDLDNIANRVKKAGGRTADQTLQHGFSRLGIVAFGGTMVEDVEQATSALLDGLSSLAGHCTIIWFEDNTRQFELLLSVLRKDDRVKVTTRVTLESTAKVPPSVQQQIILSVSLENGILTSRAMFPRGTGVIGINSTHLTKGEIDNLSRGGPGRRTPNDGTLEQLGTNMATRLFGADAGSLLRAYSDAKVTIFHDIASSKLPFESLLTKSEKKEIRPATKGGINRRLAVSGLSFNQLIAKPPHKGRLKVLLVVNPLEDLIGADEEGLAVRKALENHDNIELIEIWHQQATADAVLKGLVQADVLHYCGHAFYNGPSEKESGLNLFGQALFFTDLRKHEFPTRLAFVNACESGRVRSLDIDNETADIKLEMVGAKQASDTPESASFAEYFLRSGIEAYLGTYWKVGDDSAAHFASSIYSSLASGDSLDQAVCKSRKKLFEQGKNEWANYILYGEGHFQLIRS